MNLSRRAFILSTGVFALAAGRVSAAEKQSVLVLGAGLAGLSAAYELAKMGHTVTVLEGRDRIGGRIFTLREPFSDGLFTETGGELFADGYTRFLEYADEFGLPYSELRAEAETGGSVAEIQDGIGRNGYMKGRFFRRGDIILDHPYGLEGEEGKVLPPTLLGKHLRLIGAEIRQGKTSIADLDRISLARALRDRGVSKKAIKLIDISLNYNSVYTASAGSVLRDVNRRRAAGTVPLKLEGGNDLFVAALSKAATEKGAEIILGQRVTAISQTTDSASVTSLSGDRGQQSFKADRVVCTIPFSVLRKIRFTPGLEKPKQTAIDELDYTRVTKVYLQAKYAEWDKRSLGSSVWTDTPIERIFSSTGKTGDEKGIFTIWSDGNGSKKLERMSDSRRMAYASDRFQRILPFMKGSVERSATFSWTKDPFARGAYSHLRTGQVGSILPQIGSRAGRIHFAGEHTAIEEPGMEGALESAERVVKEISG